MHYANYTFIRTRNVQLIIIIYSCWEKVFPNRQSQLISIIRGRRLSSRRGTQKNQICLLFGRTFLFTSARLCVCMCVCVHACVCTRTGCFYCAAETACLENKLTKHLKQKKNPKKTARTQQPVRSKKNASNFSVICQPFKGDENAYSPPTTHPFTPKTLLLQDISDRWGGGTQERERKA